MSAEPAWLTSMVDQRLALMSEKIPQDRVQELDVILTTLTEPPEGASPEVFLRWNQTCDNCGMYCPDEFAVGATGRMLHGIPVSITFGACPKCSEGVEISD